MPVNHALKNGPFDIAVFDIDSTLSDDKWRVGKIDTTKKGEERFAAYHAAAGQDMPYKAVLEQVVSRLRQGVFVIFATARPGTHKLGRETRHWLEDHLPKEYKYGLHWDLLMRPTHDTRPSALLKTAMVHAICHEYPTGTIIIAADDRHDVCVALLATGKVRYVYQAKDGHLYRYSQSDATFAKDFIEARAEGYEPSAEDDFTSSVSLSKQLTGAIAYEAARPERENTPEGAVAVEPKPTPSEGTAYAPGLGLFDKGDDRTEAEKKAQRRAFVDTPKVATPGKEGDVVAILAAAAETLKSRKEVYGRSDLVTGNVMAALFPGGMRLQTANDFRMFHFMNHVVGKLVRFAGSGMTHADSAHDLINYAAFMESLAGTHTIETKKPDAV